MPLRILYRCARRSLGYRRKARRTELFLPLHRPQVRYGALESSGLPSGLVGDDRGWPSVHPRPSTSDAGRGQPHRLPSKGPHRQLAPASERRPGIPPGLAGLEHAGPFTRPDVHPDPHRDHLLRHQGPEDQMRSLTIRAPAVVFWGLLAAWGDGRVPGSWAAPASGGPMRTVGWRNDGSGRYPLASPPLEWSDRQNLLW